MSLSIFPIQSVAYVENSSFMSHPTVRYPQKFSAKVTTATPFANSDVQVLKEERGFITTYHSPFLPDSLKRKFKNCDNLQLSGTLFDDRYVAVPDPVVIPLNSSFILEDMVLGSDFKIAYVGLTNFDVTKYAVMQTYTQGRETGQCRLVWTQYVHQDNMWYQYLKTEFRSNITTLSQLLALEPYVRGVLNTDFRDIYVFGQKNSPIQYSSSSLSPEYVSRQYLFDSFDWLSVLTEHSDFTSKASSIFWELHFEAAKKIPALNVNGFQFTRDILTFIAGCRDLWSTLHGKITPKRVASVFLALKYGPTQTITDVKNAIRKYRETNFCKSGVSASRYVDGRYGTVKCTTTIRYHRSEDQTFVDQLSNLLLYLDLNPSLSNIWELIPYSFVVDWFMGIGENLDRRDVRQTLETYEIDVVYDTYTYEGSIEASVLDATKSGIINFRRYHRSCSQDAYFPLVVPTEPAAASHWLEGLALVIQRLF